MKTFKQFLTESDDSFRSEFADENHPRHSLWKHGVPAVEHNGKIYKGKRGETHQDIVNQYGLPHDHLLNNHKDRGFYHPIEKKYYNGEKSHYMDSTDIMTPMQRTRYQNRMK